MTFLEYNYLAEALSFRARPVIGVHINQSSARLCAQSNIDLLHFLRNAPPYQISSPQSVDYINYQGRRTSSVLNNLQFRFYLIDDLISIPLRVSQMVTPSPEQVIVDANDSLITSALEELSRHLQASSHNSVSSLSVSLYSSTIENASSDTLRDIACAYAGAGFTQFRCFEHDFLDNPVGYLAVCAMTDSRGEKIETIKKITIGLPAVLQGAIAGMSDNDVCLTLLVIDYHPTDRSGQYIDPGLHNELTRYRVKSIYLNLQLFQNYVMESSTKVDISTYLQTTHVKRYYEYLFSSERAAADTYADIPWSPFAPVPSETESKGFYFRPTISDIIVRQNSLMASFFNTVFSYYLRTLLIPFLAAKLFNLSESCEEAVSVGKKMANILTGHHTSAKQAARTVPAHAHLSQGKAFYTKFPMEYRIRRLADLLLQCNLLDDACIYYEALLPKQKHKASTPFIAEAYEAVCMATLQKYFINYAFDNSPINVSTEDSSKILKYFGEALRIINECLSDPALGQLSLTNASFRSPFRTSGSSMTFPLQGVEGTIGHFTPTPIFATRISIYRLFDYKRYLEIIASLSYAFLGQSFQLISSTFSYAIPHSVDSITAAVSYLVNSFLLCEAHYVRMGSECAFKAGSIFFAARLFNLAFLCFTHAFMNLDRPHLLPALKAGWWFKDVYESQLLYCRTRALRSERLEMQTRGTKDAALIDVLSNKIVQLLKTTTSKQMQLELFYPKGIASVVSHAPNTFSDPQTPIGSCFASLQRLFITNQVAVPQLMNLFCLSFSTAHEVRAEERNLRFCIKNLTPPVRNFGETPLQYTVRLFSDLIQSTNEDSSSYINAFLKKAFTPARKFVARDYLVDLLMNITPHLSELQSSMIKKADAEKLRNITEEVKVPNVSISGLYHPNLSLPSLMQMTEHTLLHPSSALQNFTYHKLVRTQVLDQLNNIKAIRAGETAMVIFCVSNEYRLLDYDLKKIELSFCFFDESNRPLSSTALEMRSKNALVIPTKMTFVSGSILLCGIPIIMPTETRNVAKMEIRGIRISFLPIDVRSTGNLSKSLPASKVQASLPSLTTSTIPNDGTMTQQTEVLLDTPVSFPVLARAADIEVSHVLPNEPVQPGQLVRGTLVVKNIGQRDVSTFYITCSHQAYCVYEHDTCFYLDEVPLESDSAANTASSNIVDISLKGALDFIYSTPQSILTELEQITAAPHEQFILKLDLAVPYIKQVLQRCMVELSMPAMLQDKIVVCKRNLRSHETLEIPILLMIPLDARPGKLSFEHYLGYSANVWPIVSESVTELFVIPANRPTLTGVTGLKAYQLNESSAEKEFSVQAAFPNQQDKLIGVILSKPCTPKSLCTLTALDNKFTYIGQCLCRQYKNALNSLQQYKSSFTPMRQNKFRAPAEVFFYDDLVCKTEGADIGSNSSILRLCKNLTAMSKRAEMHKYGPTLLSNAYAYLRKRSSFTFQDRNDAACDLTEFRKTLISDLGIVQSAILEAYVREYCRVSLEDFCVLYSSNKKTFLYREPAAVAPQGPLAATSLAAKVQCDGATNGKVDCKLIMINQGLNTISIRTSAQINGPVGFFSILGLQTVVGEVKPLEIKVVPFMACASSVGRCTISISIAATTTIDSILRKVRIVDCGMSVSLIVT